MARDIALTCLTALVVAGVGSCRPSQPQQRQASSVTGPCDLAVMTVVEAGVRAALAGAYQSNAVEDSTGVDTLMLVRDELRSDMAPIISAVQSACLSANRDTARVELKWQVLGRLSVGSPFEPGISVVLDTAVLVRVFGQWKFTTDAVLQAFISPRTAAAVGASWGVPAASLVVLDSLARRYSP